MIVPLDKSILARLKPDLLENSDDSITVEELAKNGAGIISFAVSDPCLRVRTKGQPIKWLSEQKSCDGVIFRFLPNKTEIHLVELKGKMTIDEWEDSKRQFVGGYYNALAISSVLGIEPPANITLHIAYTRDAVINKNTAMPVFLKRPAGGEISPAAEWDDGKVDLEFQSSLTLNKIKRDCHGNASVCLKPKHP